MGVIKSTNHKGYPQHYGVDYFETIPMARFEVVRMLLSISAQREWKVYQFDIESDRFKIVIKMKM